MRIHFAALGVAGLLFSFAAFPQAGGHEGHGRPESKPKPSATPPQKPADKTPPTSIKQVPTSPAFEGYRPYTADEPLIGWKEANDLVLEIGGHVGILKGVSGKDETPGAHAGHSKSKPAGTGKK